METDAQLALWKGIAPTARETKELRLSGTYQRLDCRRSQFMDFSGERGMSIP